MLNIFLAALSGMCAVGQSAFTKASSEKTNSPMRFNTFKVGIAFLLILPISFYNMNISEFLSVTLPLTLISLVGLMLTSITVLPRSLNQHKIEKMSVTGKKQLII